MVGARHIWPAGLINDTRHLSKTKKTTRHTLITETFPYAHQNQGSTSLNTTIKMEIVARYANYTGPAHIVILTQPLKRKHDDR